MIIDRRKFITKWSLYGMSSFHVYRWNQFQVIPLTVHSVQETSPNFLRRRTRADDTPDNGDISQSLAATDDRLLSHVRV